MNLASEHSTNLFSHGLRACPGQAMVRPLLITYFDLLNSLELIPSNPYYIRYASQQYDKFKTKSMVKHRDTPNFIDIRGYIRDKNILNTSDLIPCNKSSSKVSLCNIWHVYSNEKLMMDVTNYYHNIIKKHGFYNKPSDLCWYQSDMKNYTFDVIVAPKARALPLAGIISSTTKKIIKYHLSYRLSC